MDHLVLYCRAGFEKECAAEILAESARRGFFGHVSARPLSGHVIFTFAQKGRAREFSGLISFGDLVFCRQMFCAFDQIINLPPSDRISPIIALLREKSVCAGDIVVETADTDESKKILPFCGKFAPHFVKAAVKEGVLKSEGPSKDLRLHLFFISSDRVYAGLSAINNSSPWFMGIARLKFPKAAPSRSTLKLEEAFLSFLTAPERSPSLRPGMTAIDLGAAPGGWTYQLASRGIKVVAVDNGPMDPGLLRSGLVRHVKADGFSYRPERTVDWMVCDIVERPRRVAKLAGQWMANGWCDRTIFNLKLPMKKRYDEVNLCVDCVKNELAKSAAKKNFSIHIKHLYHDREEVTGFIRS